MACGNVCMHCYQMTRVVQNAKGKWTSICGCPQADEAEATKKKEASPLVQAIEAKASLDVTEEMLGLSSSIEAKMKELELLKLDKAMLETENKILKERVEFLEAIMDKVEAEVLTEKKRLLGL